VLTRTIEHPAWCDPSECDADPDSSRGCHQTRPLTVPYHDQSRSSASVVIVRFSAQTHTWICIELHTVDVQGEPVEHNQLLAPGQARILGRHLLRAGQEATEASAGS
jgi:hypothetical protein